MASYWKKNREKFYDLLIFPAPYSVPEKRKCAWWEWFIEQLSPSALSSLELDSRQVWWIIFVEFGARASSQGCTTFQSVMRQLCFLHSFCYFNVPCSATFSGLAPSPPIRTAYRTCHSIIISNPWIFTQILPPFSRPLLLLHTGPSLDCLLPERTWPSCAAASSLSPALTMLSWLPHLQICCKREIFWALLH